jgi:hypothetical protein
MVGGFVGGVVFLVSVMTGAFFYYRCRVRRRYLRARLILGGEEGIDGGADDVDKPAQSHHERLENFLSAFRAFLCFSKQIKCFEKRKKHFSCFPKA